MNSLSRQRLNDLHTIYTALGHISIMPDDQWAALTQQELFTRAMKEIGKKVNPSTLQAVIEQLEKFQLPRNVQEQEHTIGQI